MEYHNLAACQECYIYLANGDLPKECYTDEPWSPTDIDREWPNADLSPGHYIEPSDYFDVEQVCGEWYLFDADGDEVGDYDTEEEARADCARRNAEHAVKQTYVDDLGFSRVSCDCCGSSLAGMRYPVCATLRGK
jgi:hypothetical protein